MSTEMRRYLAMMRGKKVNKLDEVKKEPTMRDMLGVMRNLNKKKTTINEDFQKNISTNIDQRKAEEEMNNYFQNFNVTIEYEDLKIYEHKGAIFGGTIDGQIQFIYKVAPEEQNSGIEVNYLDGFDEKDPDNEEVIEHVENYYDVFYKYWREQLFNE